MKGTAFRHFKALNKKNWINWKRSLCGSIFEMFCPLILFFILMTLRWRIEKEYINADDLGILKHAVYTGVEKNDKGEFVTSFDSIEAVASDLS